VRGAAPKNVRLDFLEHVARDRLRSTTSSGVRLDGSKVGGSIEGAVVLIPDPMGATGGHDRARGRRATPSSGAARPRRSLRCT
jgi:hypothetical protein